MCHNFKLICSFVALRQLYVIFHSFEFCWNSTSCKIQIQINPCYFHKFQKGAKVRKPSKLRQCAKTVVLKLEKSRKSGTTCNYALQQVQLPPIVWKTLRFLLFPFSHSRVLVSLVLSRPPWTAPWKSGTYQSLVLLHFCRAPTSLLNSVRATLARSRL